ncbi:YhcH/YjgK/YiaL family protein [Chryseobacterium echinoideorum]|uniref:YhcH/YjgK/YiaL family protein n=1 Tax=Chryseobacterium echinoideorum TaxID=1549648 RepID=UPI001184818A|nr:YhcH/YjgK/YiaL family protein [Chryseobacterium echinoideorum]
MIIDTVDHLEKYIEENIIFQVNKLLNTPFEELSLGNWHILDDKASKIIILNTSNYEENVFESHKKYIDFHFPINGHDVIFFGTEKNKIQKCDYNIDQDYQLFSSTTIAEMKITKNCFAMIEPNELHSNQLTNDALKIVLKIPKNV